LSGAAAPLHHVADPLFLRKLGKNMMLQLMLDHGLDCWIGFTVKVETFLAMGVVLSLTVPPPLSSTFTSRLKFLPLCE
jgi:hypothetical protein